MKMLMEIPQAYDAQVKARQRSFPVNIVSLANDLKIEVFESDKMTDAQSGMIGPGKDGKPVIIVNRKHPATRQMFTIAHELGHFMLHQDALQSDKLPVTGIVNRVLKRESGRDLNEEELKMEADANDLAAEILMPAEAFRAAWKENENREDMLERVAEKFGVSTGAANVRASRLLGEYAV